MKKKLGKYTYVPKKSIVSVKTKKASFEGDELLDGFYLKGIKKFKKGGKPKAKAKANPQPEVRKMGNRTVAEKIMELDAKAWEDLGIDSGSQLREDKELQRKYLDKMSEADKILARASSPAVVMDILEDENYHSAWGTLYSKGRTPYPYSEFAEGGETRTPRIRSLERRAQELMGEDAWDSLSLDDQQEFMSEMVAEGVLPVPMMDGGSMYSNGGEMADGGEMMADGAEVAEAVTYLVTYELNGKSKEKPFADKGKAETFMDLMGDDDDVKNIKLTEVKPEKKKAKASKPAKASESINLFAARADAQKKTTKKTGDREEVIVPGLAKTIARFEALDEIIKNAEAEKKILDGQIKEIGREKFLERYKSEGFRPKNFNLADGDEKVLYVMSDNYKGSRYGVTPEKASLLEPYGDILEEQTTFTINDKVLNKPGVAEAISRMIMSSKILTDEDKQNLIMASTIQIVKKGTIDRLLQYDEPEMVFDLIEPVVSLR